MYTQNVAMMQDLDSLIVNGEKTITKSEEYLDLDRNLYDMNIISPALETQDTAVKVNLQDMQFEHIDCADNIFSINQKLVDAKDTIQMDLILEESTNKVWRHDYRFTLSFGDTENILLCSINQPLLIESSQMVQNLSILFSKALLNSLSLECKDNPLQCFPKITYPGDEGKLTIHLSNRENPAPDAIDCKGKDGQETIQSKQSEDLTESSDGNLQSNQIQSVVIHVKIDKVDYGFEQYERSILVASMKATITQEFKDKTTKQASA